MNFTQREFDDYKSRCLSFKDITEECLPLLTESGKLLAATFNGENNPTWVIFVHDIIKRIRENLFFITQTFPPQPTTSVPLKILLRSVFSDLISVIYLLDNLPNEGKTLLFTLSNDLDAIDGKIKFAECEKDFFIMCGETDRASFF